MAHLWLVQVVIYQLKLKVVDSLVDFIAADLVTTSIEHTTMSNTCKTVLDQAANLLNGLVCVINAAGVLWAGAIRDDNSGETLENYHITMETNVQVPFEIKVHSIPHLK